MQTDQQKSSDRLLSPQESTTDTLTVIENDSQVFEHRCALEHSEHFKGEAVKARRACNKLVLTACVSLIFCGTEAVGGTISGSLAILCDAAH